MKIFKLLNNDDKKILKNSTILCSIFIVISIVLSLFFDWWRTTFFISIIMGYLSSIICYFKLVYVTFKETAFPSNKSKKSFIINNISSMLIYFLFLLINQLINWLNIFLCFLGMMIVKIVIYILYAKKGESR